MATGGLRGSDPETGDGAGLLIQMPHQFLQKECSRLGIDLPGPGEYGVGMVFLPPQPEGLERCRALLTNVINDEGLKLLGWRDVPVDPTKLGVDSHAVRPHIQQVFIGAGPGIRDTDHLERKLYVVRKVIEHSKKEWGVTEEEDDYFYVCSMSCNTIVYKGLVHARQLSGFYHDLADQALTSAFALVHSRFSTNTLGHWKLAHPYRYLAHNGEINTLRGNLNWMHAREARFQSPLFGDDMAKIPPVMTAGASDTASIDNALELLLMTGRDLEQCHAHADTRSLGTARKHAPREEGLLRIPLLPHGALGRPWL